MTIASAPPMKPGFVAVMEIERPRTGLAERFLTYSVAIVSDVQGRQLNTPITCGNVLVVPGDLVFADEHGVVVIRREEAEAVLERAQGRIEREQGWLEAIARDDFSPLVDTDEQLHARGCLVVRRADEL